MVLAHHKDSGLRLRIQTVDAQEHIIPFVEEWLLIGPSTTVLEVGCGEGGVLLAFLERGAQGVGVEISESRYRLAQTYLHSFLAQNQALLLREDIYQVSPDQLPYRFDLIILKDVIEHIPQPERLLNHLRRFLKERGYIFIGFPPWQMPFGGHQQVCRSKLLSIFPYLHLLPRSIYKWILRMAGEEPSLIAELLSLRETGLSIEKLEKVAHQTGYRTVKKQFYLITPIYKYKFGLRPISQIPLISKIPYLRNFLTTGCYYLLTPT